MRRWPIAIVSFALLGFVALPSVWRLGEARDGKRLVSTGQVLALDESAIKLPARGLDLVLSADGKTAYAKTTRGVSKVDVASGAVGAEFRLDAGSSMCGIDLGEAGLVVTDAQRTLFLLDPETLALRKKIDLGAATVGGPAYPCGVKVQDGFAYVALNRANTLAKVDLTSGAVRSFPVGTGPYGVAVDGERVFVTCWGRVPGEGKAHAPTAEVEVEVDRRGVPTGGTLTELNAADGAVVRRWNVAGQPSEIALNGESIFVACANGDLVTRIPRAGGEVKESRIEGLPGAAPSSLVLDGDRLWVALSGENRLMALDLATGRTLGFLETGWYPVAVRRGPAGLIVADAKGDGAPVKNVRSMVGTVRRLDPAKMAPLPAVVAEKRSKFPVNKVVYIIKENRTYDQLFGDIKTGKGDPSLVMYGRDVTPNHHALAEEFVLLDNYACNGSISTDGHAWAIEGQATAFYERSFGGWTRSYPFGGDEPLAISEGGHLWDATLEAHKSFRNFGEFVYADQESGTKFITNYQAWREGKAIPWKARIGVDRVKPYTSKEFPGWNMNIPDGYRADVFLKEFKAMERDGRMPDLTILYLPQDHTSGDAVGAPKPKAHIADNDLAVGRIVEAISRSKFWKDTAIFVTEDDPQDGLDSVDGHRSVCLVASPYTRRGITSSAFYDQTSVLHTICDILGAKPYTRFIAQSPTMVDLFAGSADLKPYVVRTPAFALNELNPPKLKAAKLDLSQPDATDDEVMDRVLWGMSFPHRPYPHDER